MKLLPLYFLLFFFAFRLVWSYFFKRERIKSTPVILSLRKIFEVSLYFVIPVLLVFLEVPDFLRISSHEVLGRIIVASGGVFSLIGLSLMIWTRASRPKNWAIMGDVPANQLVITGAYKVSRHPYYVGAFIFICGIYLQLNSVFILLLVPPYFFLKHVMNTEDKELEAKFGDQFVEYRKKVGILPFRFF